MDRQDIDDGIHGSPYGRPSTSAWIAAGSVAFAVFVLGGFIKTYRQLEALREESRQEIRELRSLMETLKDRPKSLTASPSLEPLPPSIERAASRSPVNRVRPAAPLPESGNTDENGVRYSLGRSAIRPAGAAGRGSADAGQVLAVNMPAKRLMIEGGRAAGFIQGTRLEVLRAGRWIGDLRVIDVYDSMSACEVVHSKISPQPGDTVRIP